MKIELLCSDLNHPVNDYLKSWMNLQQDTHNINLLHKKSQLSNGDILFLISCSEIIDKTDRSKFKVTLILHASDLPKGRGWSPHIWEIINGADHITLSLLEAEDILDSGNIWFKRQIPISKDALWDEINNLLFTAEIDLIDSAVKYFGNLAPEPQIGQEKATYYPKRTPRESKINPYKTIAEQFNQIRICDPNRFPAFFELHGKKYKIILEKLHE